MEQEWLKWIKSFKLPDDVHLYTMNGKVIFTLSGYGIVATNYVYFADLKDNLVNGVKLDNLKTEEEVHKAIANTVLKIQIDLKYPKSYTTYRDGNGKQAIVRP